MRYIWPSFGLEDGGETWIRSWCLSTAKSRSLGGLWSIFRACPEFRSRGAETALNKPVMEAYLIDADRLSKGLGGLQKESMHCAMMAEICLKKAIKDYVSKRRQVR